MKYRMLRIILQFLKQKVQEILEFLLGLFFLLLISLLLFSVVVFLGWMVNSWVFFHNMIDWFQIYHWWEGLFAYLYLGWILIIVSAFLFGIVLIPGFLVYHLIKWIRSNWKKAVDKIDAEELREKLKNRINRN